MAAHTLAFSGAPDTVAEPREVARMSLIVNSCLSAKILLAVVSIVRATCPSCLSAPRIKLTLRAPSPPFYKVAFRRQT